VAKLLATLVVLNYDGRALLDACLPSVLAQRFADFEVVVVDNGSRDGSIEHIRARWPQVRVVALAENVGVTAALNAMVATARGEFVALLNNDVELEPEWLALVVEALRANPQAAAAAGKLLNFHRRSQIDGAGDILYRGGAATRRGHGEFDRGQYDTPEAMFGVCAGAAMYRRSAFERVGPFDERFFAFYEDVDWNFRAQLAGLTSRYVPSAVAFHMGGATLGQGMTDFARYQVTRNLIWMVAKDFPMRTLFRHAPGIVYVQAAQFAGALQARQVGAWAHAVRDALHALPAVLRDRRAVQATRAVAAAQLERVVAARASPWRRVSGPLLSRVFRAREEDAGDLGSSG